MKKKALTLTEVLIAVSIGVAIFIPTSIMYSNSSRQLEKTSNLSFASGLGRYIVQTMMTMKIDDIKDTEQVSPNGISFCDSSDDNIFFNTLFNLKEQTGGLNKGYIKIGADSCPKLYNRLAKYDYRYMIKGTPVQLHGSDDDKISSVRLSITWKEFGENKIYEYNVVIVEK